MWSELFLLPLAFAAIYLVFYRYSSPTIRGSLGRSSSYSTLPSSLITFLTFFLCKSSIIFKNYFLFSSSILGRYLSLTVSSIYLLTFSFFSLAILFSSILGSIILVLKSECDLYFECISSYWSYIIFSCYYILYLLCFYLSFRIYSYFFSCYSIALTSVWSRECLSLRIFCLFSFYCWAYRL